jgi:hypothetical protein
MIADIEIRAYHREETRETAAAIVGTLETRDTVPADAGIPKTRETAAAIVGTLETRDTVPASVGIPATVEVCAVAQEIEPTD